MDMGTRKLTEGELERLFRPLLQDVRNTLKELSAGDSALLWALRRKLAKELVYDERGKPEKRRRLKRQKRRQQEGRCAICGELLPERGAVLDRLEPMEGYTLENLRLLCPTCDHEAQAAGGFQD